MVERMGYKKADLMVGLKEKSSDRMKVAKMVAKMVGLLVEMMVARKVA